MAFNNQGPIAVKQVVSARLVTDETTASAVFSTLPNLTVNITTEGSTSLLMTADFSGWSNAANAGGVFILNVDGADLGNGCGTTAALAFTPSAGAVSLQTGILLPGPHTVTLRWRTVGGGTFFASAATQSALHHVTLTVQEVA